MHTNHLTRQSLTDKEYLTLLGICQWVFNSNCHFIIEMIDREHHAQSDESWFDFLQLTAGQLVGHKNLVESILGTEIHCLFENLKNCRNTIIHSFPTGEKVEEYYVAMYRKDAASRYITIDKNYLRAFIRDNEKLHTLIYAKRNSIGTPQT